MIDIKGKLNGFETGPRIWNEDGPTDAVIIRIPIAINRDQYVELLNMKRPIMEIRIYEEVVCGEAIVCDEAKQ